MSLAIAASVFVGFAPTYFLKAYFDGPPLSLLIHVHGLAFTAWIVLFVAQTILVARHRVRFHRRLGTAGAALAGVMVVLGLAAALVFARNAYAAGDTSVLGFLVIPFGDTFVFASLVAAALVYRRRPETHKRLMLLATISLLGAAIARWPHPIFQSGNAPFFVVTDLFIAVCVVRDLVALRRVHPALVWGGLLVVGSQPVRMLLADTRPWLAFAGVLVK